MRRYWLTSREGARIGFSSASAASRYRDKHVPLAPIFDNYLNREVPDDRVKNPCRSMLRYQLIGPSGHAEWTSSKLAMAFSRVAAHFPNHRIYDTESKQFIGAAPKAAPNGPQKYRGCQEHEWEPVVPDEDAKDRDDVADRLRVPGGWLYRNGPRMVFVPMPEAVGYEV